MLSPGTTLNCNGKLLSLEEPVAMAIINLTPDSFYAGSRLQAEKEVLERMGQFLEEGAAIIDLGGMSSRPGAAVVSPAEELRRLLPHVRAASRAFPRAILSIDTVHAEVARVCVEEGAGMINDISAGKLDPEMYPVVASLGVPYVLMHMQKRPENMQQAPAYEDVVLEILDFFIAEVGKLRALHVKDIVIDPGFGFGKLAEHNFRLLRQLDRFALLELPLMAGISRKSMIYKTLQVGPEKALNGTTALHMAALERGAKILRVHDVAPALEVIKLHQQLLTSE